MQSKVIKLTLSEYEELGGKVCNLNVRDIQSNYSDRNDKKEVRSIVYERQNDYNNKTYRIQFIDNSSCCYASFYINVNISVRLGTEYTE